ncbi:DUF4336 domain-containing protein [Novosphingobium sp. 9U]|uniref:DUF4336 domain-containing protein n=1 Tax=Novosphingobium sp. 9U TaxID=2653158 RepID=UPI00191622F8|nr:DUF4336 domain-containing protein [Novosphingobium sp. 9U]
MLVAAGLTALALAVRRKGRVSDAQITYPPLDQPKPLGDGVWIVDSGPISAAGMKLPVRMTMLRLSDGSVLLHSPTRYTPRLAQAIEEIGPVRHLIAPTIAHSSFLAEWQLAYPTAKLWAVPGLRDRGLVRRSGVRIDADLAHAAPAEWADAVDQGLVRGGGGFCEAWFFHRPSRTLVLADLIENMDPAKLPPVTSLLMRAAAATRGTTGFHVRAVLLSKKAEARKSVSHMIATEPRRVIFSHGECFGEHASEHLRRAFAWLMKSG